MSLKLQLLAVSSFALTLWGGLPASGIIVYDNPNGNTSKPVGDQGWDSVGKFAGSSNKASGVAIDPYWILATRHQTGSVGEKFNLNGVDYTTDAMTEIPGSDLWVWRVSTPMANFSPIYTGDPTGESTTIIGYGIHNQGDPVTTSSPAPDFHGWKWGATKGKSWGTNTVDLRATSSGYHVLAYDFDPLANEGTLADKDSGGGLFVDDGGVWKVAGIHYAVENRYSYSPTGVGAFYAAVFAGSGVTSELYSEPGGWSVAAGPQFILSHDVSYYASQINAIIPEPTGLALVAAAGVLMIRRRHAA